MDIRILKLRPSGMFSNVNEVIQQLFLAEQHNYRFIIKWSSSPYKDQKKNIDPWLYYFKPCFDIGKINTSSLLTLTSDDSITCAKNNIITPRLFDGICEPLFLPKDKGLVHNIITKYIHVNDTVWQEVEKFKQNFFDKYIIGLHIRGPLKIDGGLSLFRKKHKCEYGVPFSLYFDTVKTILKNKPNAKIFACSDSAIVTRKIYKEFGSRVITYHSTKSAFGETHNNDIIMNKGENFPKYKLGLDVVVEAYLLSNVDYLVHGVSNITNFVLCKNINLKNNYVYQQQADNYNTWWNYLRIATKQKVGLC